MNERVRPAAEWCRRKASEGKRRGKRGFVYFITSDKNIQAVKTAAAWGIVAAAVNATANVIQPLVNVGLGAMTNAAIGYRIGIPVSFVVLGLMIGVFWVVDFADENTDEWRQLVEEATGEEAADDDADEDE